MLSKRIIFTQPSFILKYLFLFINRKYYVCGIKFKIVAEQQLKMTKAIAKGITKQWREVIQSRGLKQTWVADRAGISPEHLSNILADRVLLTEDCRDKINEALETDFK